MQENHIMMSIEITKIIRIIRNFTQYLGMELLEKDVAELNDNQFIYLTKIKILYQNLSLDLFISLNFYLKIK